MGFKERTPVMKLTIQMAILIGVAAVVPVGQAQIPQLNLHFGVGTAMNSSSNTLIDTFGTGSPYTTPRLGGLFLDGGASMMVTPNWGASFDVSWRATQAAYTGLQYRPLFYSVDGVWQPLGNRVKRIVPEIQAGVGGVHLSYYYNSQYCDQFTGCSNSNIYLEGSSHFQIDMAAAVRVYATPHIFFRPAVEAHWVNNFFQFGSNWVPEYTLGIGYSIGGE
jgi:hypothetical protein